MGVKILNWILGIGLTGLGWWVWSLKRQLETVSGELSREREVSRSLQILRMEKKLKGIPREEKAERADAALDSIRERLERDADRAEG